MATLDPKTASKKYQLEIVPFTLSSLGQRNERRRSETFLLGGGRRPPFVV